MKLLIVEDEQATREGLKSIIDWEELGIHEIRTAANGQRGLTEARRYRPDIVLTDIRMPMMDGIHMAEEIMELFPQCCIIFLSAYAEISYYREAMRLKVVSYVEKPVTPDNLKKVMRQAVEERQSQLSVWMLKKQQTWRKLSELAQRILGGEDSKELVKEFEQFCKEKSRFIYPYVTAMVVQIGRSMMEEHLEQKLAQDLEEMAQAMQMWVVCTGMEKKYAVLLWFGKNQSVSQGNWQIIWSKIKDILKPEQRIDITVGETVSGIERARVSYGTAINLLQKSFYEEYGTLVIWEGPWSLHGGRRYSAEKEKVLEAIDEMDRKRMAAEEEALYQSLQTNRDAAPDYVKDLYAEFFFAMRRMREQHGGLGEEEWSRQDWGIQTENRNLSSLHGLYKELTEQLFFFREQEKKEQSVILLTKNYIRENYQNPYLSLQDISNYVHLSNSHICMLFKKETGITINQYMTEIRMEKAKKMLKDGRYSVSVISEMAGYKDSSYFGKAFRKNFGLTPLEYRDQWIKGKGEE